MQIIIVVFILISSIFVLPAAAQELPHGDFSQMRAEGRFTVTQVVAPDVVGLNDGRLIHLTGIDIPDLWDKDGPGPFAQTAQRVVTDMLIGQDVRVFRTLDTKRGRTNRMGHHLAHLERASDGAWVQGALLRLGLARMRTTADNIDMSGQMLMIEAQARQEKSGLWADERYRVLTPEDLDEGRLNKFQIVEGRVRNASTSKNRIYLNFGDDWHDDFTATIAPEDRKAFNKIGIDPLQWNDKVIRLRGWMEYYNGPNISLTHPQQVELLPEE